MSKTMGVLHVVGSPSRTGAMAQTLELLYRGILAEF